MRARARGRQHRDEFQGRYPAAVRRDRRPRPAHAAAVALRARMPTGCSPPSCRSSAPRARTMNDHEFRNFARAALEKHLPAERRGPIADFLNRLHYQPLDVTQPPTRSPRSPSGSASAAAAWRSSCRPRRTCSRPPSTASPRRPDLRRRAHRAGEAARPRPRHRAARSTTRSRAPSPRSASSASTTTSARRRCRTCSRCASPT